MAGGFLDQMLMACHGFKHVKKVITAVTMCLHQALGLISSSGKSNDEYHIKLNHNQRL